MREKDIESKCRDIAKRYGALLPKWVSPGHRGVPDRILILPNGQVWFLEFKAPGKKLDPLQDVWRRRLTDRKQKHAIISDPVTFEALLRAQGIPAESD